MIDILLVVAIAGGVGLGFSIWMILCLICGELTNAMYMLFVCLPKDHRKFYYVGHTEYPAGHHVYWCGRCGYESSDEHDAKVAENVTAMPGYAVRQ